MEGSYWKALEIHIFLQKQTSDMELLFIHSLLGGVLVLSVKPFGLPPLVAKQEIGLKTGV